MIKRKYFLGMTGAIACAFSFSAPVAYALSNTISASSQTGAGIAGNVFPAQALGITVHPAPPTVSWGGGSVSLTDESSGSTMDCGGQTMTNGLGVNLQSDNHVGITNVAEFIRWHGIKLYSQIANAPAYKTSDGSDIHQYSAGGCNYTLDNAIAPTITYQYKVYALEAYNSNDKTVNIDSDRSKNGQSENAWYCPYSYVVAQVGSSDGYDTSVRDFAGGASRNTPNKVFGTGLTKVTEPAGDYASFNGKVFAIPGSFSYSDSITVGCAGLYEVQTTILANGKPIGSEFADNNVPPSAIGKNVTLTPTGTVTVTPPPPPVQEWVPPQEENPTPDVYISQ